MRRLLIALMLLSGSVVAQNPKGPTMTIDAPKSGSCCVGANCDPVVYIVGDGHANRGDQWCCDTGTELYALCNKGPAASGEANTQSSPATGESLVLTKSAVDLPIKGIKATDSSCTITSNSTDILIDCAGGGTFTVEDIDSVPTFAGVSTIQFDQADGFVIASGSDVRIDLNPALVNHDALLNFLAAEHVDWASSGTGTIHTTNYADLFGYDEVFDEGLARTKRAVVNFIGGSITCVDNSGAGRTDCTVTDADTIFSPNADPGVDHSSYVAGHANGANCAAGNYPLGVDAAGAVESCTADADTQLTGEQVEDFTGAMTTLNTETLITVTYQDVDGTLDFVVEPNLSNYTNDAGFLTSEVDGSTTNELQNLFSTIDAPAGTDPVADTNTDTLQLLAGNSTLTITGDAAGDSVTFETIDVTCTGCLGTTEVAALDAADTTTGTFADARVSDTLTHSGGSVALESLTVTAIADLETMIGDGAGSAAFTPLPAGGTDGCSGTADKPIWTASTRTWSCGTDAGAGGGMTSWTVGDDGSPTGDLAVNDGETVQFIGGEAIDTTIGGTASAPTITVSSEDAAAANKGVIQLAGDLGGTASAPTVVGVQADAVAMPGDTTGAYVAGITGGAGVTSTGGGAENATVTIATASQETGFLADGGATSLTCGSSTAGQAQVMDDGTFEICDGATTPVVQTFTPGAHTTAFVPNAAPGVDHSSYVAGHTDGANCAAGNYPLGVDAAGATQGCTADANTQRTDEEITDLSGGMVTGNTETLITVTFQDGDNTVDFVVDNDLANYSNATSNFSTGAHTDTTKLPLAGGTMTGQLIGDNLGIEFTESDTNPACAAGNYNIFADLSETGVKVCNDGTAALVSTGAHTTASTWSTISGKPANVDEDSTDDQPLDADLTAVAALAGTGLVARTGAATYSERTITGDSEIVVSNGDGVSGNPTLSIAAAMARDTELHAQAHAVDGSDHTLSGGTDGQVLQATGAATFEMDWSRARSHATDCTALTDGEANEFCLELDSERWYTCQPSAGLCDTVGEWILTGGDGHAVFTPNANPATDHSSYVAGHANGANCATGEIPSGVDAAGAVEGCYEPSEADISDLNHTDTSKVPLAGGTMTGQLVTDNLAIEFTESDTNPACAAGNYNVFADLSETAVKVCNNGTAAVVATGTHTTDTNANTICTGTGNYLDGEGGCDALVTNATHTGDVTGSGALTIAADKVLASMVAFNYATSSSEGGNATLADGVVASVCGKHLTEVSGDCDVNDDVITRVAAHIYIDDVTVDHEITIMLPPWAGVMTRIDCEKHDGTGSVTIRICDTEDRGDDTCGTNVLSSTAGDTLACALTPTADTALNLAADDFVARDKVTLVVTAVTDTGDLDLMITATVND